VACLEFRNRGGGTPRPSNASLFTYVTVICGHIAISMLCGKTAYCPKLSGEDLSRYSNKVESVDLRKSSHYHYLTKKLMSQLEAMGQCIPPTRHILPVSRLKFNYLLIGPLPTFPENLMQIRSDVFVQSC